MLRQESEPLLRESTLVDARLVLECNAQWSFPLIDLSIPHEGEGVVESLLTPHQDVPLSVLLLLFGFLKHDSPDKTFCVELKDLRNLHDKVLELHVYNLLIRSDEHIDEFLIGNEESDDCLEPPI